MLDEPTEYSTKITKEIECPFCKTKISVHYRPSMRQYHVSRISAKTARTPFMSKEKYEILVEKCPNCGKSKAEIEKALAKGKELPNEEIVRRLREAGLDPTRLK